MVALVQAATQTVVADPWLPPAGFVMLGMFSLNAIGLNGSILQMVNHGLSTGALFLLVGMLYERRHTRMISDFGGIARPMPVFAAFFGLVTMSSIGLPGLNGFVGEFLILLGAYMAHPFYAVLATSGVVLAAAYMLWMFRRVMFGPIETAENRGLIDLDLREKLVMIAMMIPIIWIGVYPETFLRRIEPSVLELLNTIERRGGSALAAAEAAPPVAEPEPAPTGEVATLGSEPPAEDDLSVAEVETGVAAELENETPAGEQP